MTAKAQDIPRSLDAERAVLGAIIMDNSMLAAVASLLSSVNAFSSESNRAVFSAIVEMRSKDQLVDLVTLSHKLAKDKLLKRSGGPSYLAELTNGAVVDVGLARQYAGIVREKWLMRDILNLARNMASKVVLESSAGDVLTAARADIDRLLGGHIQVNGNGSLLVSACEFLARHSHDIDWLVDGIIQSGANGFIVASPKVGKSWMGVDLCLSLALGVPWLEFAVYRRTKVAIITREDTPDLTRWRMRRLLLGKGREEEDLEGWLYINSKDESPQFKLDVPEQLNEMLAALRELKPGFVMLDVLNVLHNQDENDQGQMRKVLDCAETIHREIGASLCILHHFRKGDSGRLTERMRGSSAIAGFAEWVMGIGYASEDPNEPDALKKHTRCVDFELKAAQPHDRVYYSVVGEQDSEYGSQIQRVEWEATRNGRRSGQTEKFNN